MAETERDPGHGHPHTQTTGRGPDDHHAQSHAARHVEGGADPVTGTMALAAGSVLKINGLQVVNFRQGVVALPGGVGALTGVDTVNKADLIAFLDALLVGVQDIRARLQGHGLIS